MIRIEAVWLCTTPMDMRAGSDTALARVVQVFGAARPHHAYVFANKRHTRLKVPRRPPKVPHLWPPKLLHPVEGDLMH